MHHVDRLKVVHAIRLPLAGKRDAVDFYNVSSTYRNGKRCGIEKAWEFEVEKIGT